MLYSKLSDQDLVHFLKKGDSDAFTVLYDRYKELMYVYACKIVKDFDIAEDLVQDVFISIWEKRETLAFDSSVSSYLYSAVRYRFFDLVDRQKVRTDYAKSLQLFLDKGEFSIDNYMAEKELAQAIEREITYLPEKMREIFILSRKANLKNAEIAGHLGISEKTVKNQVSLALRELRKKLGLLISLFL